MHLLYRDVPWQVRKSWLFRPTPEEFINDSATDFLYLSRPNSTVPSTAFTAARAAAKLHKTVKLLLGVSTGQTGIIKSANGLA
jgi:hypothetical protein